MSEDIPANVGLSNGDKLSQREFHDIYETMPEDFKAELIAGFVYVSMPLKRPHAKSHVRLSSIFDRYEVSTPGVEVCDNATVILGEKDEVQPDLLLRILPNHGGQSRTTYDDYVEGAPELVAEVTHSSRAVELHRKLSRYARFGVIEYLVVCLWPRKIYWFDLRKSQKNPQESVDGIFKSNSFPGLWIHGDGLLSRDYQLSMQTLEQGLASAEHNAFVDQLNQKN